ncbi:oxysterol-binding protein-related protein 9 isoform X3 [Bradysia coprophila]|uniref:oxysterol-binding protein-related protein 9 isoform X3 n=1 Tax=Bradysia coprophila TaxID=38358 RepID=UPI00187D8B2D|nr:oxysterol-binding protein-related protein 9 isoform X3 [Bradysia coprophila]
MLEGTLSKWTNVMKGWQYRWFVLDENAGLLSYYTSKEKMMKGVRRGCVRLKGAVIGIDDQDVNTFTITVDHKTFHFQARDSDEREKWVRRLEDTILRHAHRVRGLYYNNGTSVSDTSGGAARRPNYLQTLDKRVSEADAYLQLMIEQTNKLEEKLSKLSDKEEQEKNRVIQENANAMLDSIKHSIVLLQIAKNTAHPINGIYQGPSTSNKIDAEESTEILPPVGIPLPHTGVAYGSECIESKRSLVIQREDDSAPVMTSFVPETSYSSSEGEDDFYDAYDDPFSSHGNSPTCNTRTFPDASSRNQAVADATPAGKKDEVEAPAVQPKEKKDTFLPYRNDGSLDYDALYEDESESDLSMESHGSVVTHLLSQVKIGMDLTKVVLPTFILERRSLLEMYADYFAHPDLFLKIADLKDPRDRMVQVARWYLSAYHAGRKSAVAKKPYNPILGEVFQCYWDIPTEKADSHCVEDGPIPWCRRDQLTFIAEQVSHHPPISAFYAEHYNKRISFSAYVWTKSKFLGLSIGVHNIGHGVVTVSDYNEEYVLTFPNGYGRSILTVPWIELGGTVTITCAKTGYHADIDFLTKPFYGGKRNKITAEIYAPNEKKSFLSVSGEWSGLMESKHNLNDGNKQKPEVFVDVNCIPIFKKNVRPIVEQTENESRKIWMEVTAGLRLNDIERATNAKSQVEQKQRDEAKLRKETNEEWDTKYFKSVADSWIYTKPLTQRLHMEQKSDKR